MISVNSTSLYIITIGLFFLNALLLHSFFGPFVILGFVALMLFTIYYCYSFINTDLLIYPITLSILLGASLKVLTDGSLPISLFQILLVFSVVVFLLVKAHKSEMHFFTTGYEILSILFLALIFLTTIYSSSRVETIIGGLRVTVLFLFVLFVANLITKIRTISNTLILFCSISLILSLISIFQTLLNPEAAVQNLLNAGAKIERSGVGIFTDPNVFAATLILPVSYTTSTILSNVNVKKKVIAAFVLIILVAGIASTFSRSVLLATIISIIICALKFNKVKPLSFLFVFGFLIIIAVPDLRVNLLVYLDRFLNLFFSSTIDDSSNIRILLAIGAFNMFADTYMLGVGYDAFSENFTNYFNSIDTIGVVEPHNIMYTVVAELGLIGLLLFLSLIYIVFKTIYKNLEKAENEEEKIIAVTLFAGLISYFVFYQFYDGGLKDNIVMLMVGISASFKIIKQRKPV